jgi:hypothetical protein
MSGSPLAKPMPHMCKVCCKMVMPPLSTSYLLPLHLPLRQAVDRLLKRGLKRPGNSAGQHPDDSSSSGDEGNATSLKPNQFGTANKGASEKASGAGGSQPSPSPSTPAAGGSQDAPQQQQGVTLKEGGQGHSSGSEGEDQEGGVRK